MSEQTAVWCDAGWTTPRDYTNGWPTAWTRPHQNHECRLKTEHGGDHICDCGDVWTWAESVGMST